MQTVSPIDPIAVSRIVQSAGLLSPSYPRPQKSNFGSVLQTQPDLTPTSVDLHRANGKSIWSDLPRVPQRDHLLGYGTVNRTITPDPDSEGSSAASLPPQPHPVPPAAQIPQASTDDRLKDAKKRADYRVKFSILREAYPEMKIPEPNETQPIDEIDIMYKQYVKRIHIDTSVDQNKTYLLILWMVLEVIACRYIGLPMKGYTKYQFKYMGKYQMLLIELGERSYATNLGEGWPVEVRLLGMAVFNGVIFVLVKMLADKVGGGAMAEDLTSMIDDFLTSNGSKSKDVLRRAEAADADHPPEPMSAASTEPPLGGLGNMLANLVGAFAGGDTKPAAAPEVKKPSTFGARRNEGNPREV